MEYDDAFSERIFSLKLKCKGLFINVLITLDE